MSRLIDLTGQKFGLLTVVKFSRQDRRGNALWECLCECGKVSIKAGYHLKSGNTKSCGCLRSRQNAKFVDLTGQEFGSLKVLRYVGNNKHRQSMFECECSCKNKTRIITMGGSLKNGNTKSCGCFKVAKCIDMHTKHNLNNTKIYRIFYGIKDRCNNHKNHAYCNYGGRGIAICNEWKDDFQSFYNWSMANGYEEGLTIDRIDNDGNYCPENCRWTTRIEQQSNRRVNLYVYLNGKKMTITELARITGENRETLRRRYHKNLPLGIKGATK